MSEYGIINCWFTASCLIPYPGVVKGNNERHVSLREAVRLSLSHSVLFCRCRKGCLTHHCRCRVSKILCSSRCHKGLNNDCKNNKVSLTSPVTSDTLPAVPEYGGQYDIDGQIFTFSHTCPINTWLALIKAYVTNFPSSTEDQDLVNTFGKIFLDLLELIKADDFNQAKFKIAEDNNINANNFNIR